MANGQLTSSFVNNIITSMQKHSPLFCVTMLTVSKWEENLIIPDQTIPIIQISPKSSMEMKTILKEASSQCPNYIIICQNIQSLRELFKKYKNGLHLSTGRFAIVMDVATIGDVKRILLQEKLFSNMLHVAIFRRVGYNNYNVHVRDDMQEKYLKLVNKWNGIEFEQNSKSLYPLHRLENLFGRKLIARSFSYAPYTYKDTEQDPRYQGFEVKIFSTVARSMNFTFDLLTPSDGRLWGEDLGNGTFTGLVGDIQYKRGDIGFADLFILPDRKKYIDYLEPHDIDYVCFLVAKPPPRPHWMALMLPFHLDTWIATVASLAICIIFIMIYARLYRNSEFSAVNGGLYLVAVFFDESYEYTDRLRNHAIQLFMFFFMFAFFIITMAYRGSLNAVLTVTTFPQPIDTLQQLAAQDVPVGSFEATFQNSVDQSLDPYLRKIAETYTTHYDFGAAFKNASENRLVMAESKQFLEYNMRKKFTNRFGQTSMHIMRECFMSFRVAFAIPQDSIYKKRFEQKIRRLTEGGLLVKWFRDEMDKAAKLARQTKTSTIARPLSTFHLQAPFLLTPMLLALSTLVFVVEYSLGKPVQKKKIRN